MDSPQATSAPLASKVKPPSRGIRARIASLFVLGAIPVCVAIVYQTQSERDAAIRAEQAKLGYVVAEITDQHEHVNDLSEQMLLALRLDPDIRALRDPACSAALARVLERRKDHFANLNVLDLQGRPICRAVPSTNAFPWATSPAFQAALKSDQLVVGDVMTGPVTGKTVMPVFLVLRDESGAPRAMLLAGLSLEWMKEVAARVGFPKGAVIGLLDASNRVAFRYPDAEHQVGKDVSNTDFGRAIAHSAQHRGVFRGPALLGEPRLIAFEPFGHQEGQNHVLWVSVPMGAVMASVPKTSLAIGATTLLLFLLLLVALWLASDHMILRPIGALTGALQRLARGDLSTRVQLTETRSELGALATLFDETVESLSGLLDAQRSNRALKLLLAIKASSTDDANDTALFGRICQSITESSDFPVAWIGRARQDEARTLEPLAWSGIDGAVLHERHQSWGDNPAGKGAAETAVRENRIVTISDLIDPAVSTGWRETSQRLGLRSAIALPLRSPDGVVKGVLSIFSREVHAFGELEARLLAQAGDDISRMVRALRDREARRVADHALQATLSMLDRAEEIGCTGSWRMDLESGQVDVSAEFLRIAGLQVFGRNVQALLDMVYREDSDRVRAVFRNAVDSGVEYDIEHRLVTPAGQIRTVHVRSIPVSEVAGPRQLFGTMRDITDELEMRIALRERVKEMRCLLAVFRETEQLDVPFDEVLQRVVDALPDGWLHAEDARARIRCGDITLTTPGFVETPWMLTVAFVSPQRSGDVTIAYLHEHDPQAEGPFLAEERQLLESIIKRLADVGAARDAAARLKEREALYSAIVNQARDGIITVDMETGKFFEFNDVAPATLGYTREGFAQLGIADLDAHLTAEQMQAALAAMLQPEGATVETLARCADGSLRDVRISARPMSVGGRTFLAAILSDQSETKRTEAALRRRTADQQMLANATRAILHATDERTLMESVCDILVRDRGYCMAWVGVPEQDGLRRILPVVHAGKGADYIANLNLTWADEPRGQGPTGRAVREGHHVVAQRILTDPNFALWREAALAHGYGSTCAIPLLRAEGIPLGALSVYAVEAEAFGPEETLLLLSVADSLAFGIRALRDREAQRRTELENLKLSLAIEQSPNSVVVTNLHAEIEYVNDAFTLSSGYSRDEVMGRNPRILKSGETPDSVYADMWAHLTAGLAWRGEMRNRRKDGLIFTEHATIVPLRDASGAVCNYVAIKEDITARKAADELLRKLSRAVEQSPASIAITDVEARLEYVNPAFLRHTGYSFEELRGANPRALQSGKTPQSTYTEMWAALTAGQTWQGEFQNCRKDGTEYTELATLAPIRDEHGRVTHYVAIKDDITERKRLDLELDEHRHHLEDLVEVRTVQLREAQARAEAANHAKSAFLANMSHEIRTPLNAIIGLTHLLTQRLAHSEHAERLRKVEGSARHLLGIINDILDISKVEAGKMRVEHIDFPIAEVLDGVRDALGERARDKGLALAFEVGPDVPRLFNGDPLRLTQVLLNLGSNAVKFTASGTVTVRLRAEMPSVGPMQVCFEVQDTGIGMDSEQISRLFQPFEQADVSTTRQYGGTGLGLAICGRLVDLLGGTIGVDSQPGVGSTFWFRIPVLPALGSRSALVRGSSGSTRPLPERRPAADVRVLLVEDDAINQEVATELLQAQGFQVEVASNGAIALEMARSKAYDAVLMDLQMPVMDGLTATRALRQMREHIHTPILALTASAFDEDKAACIAVGMDDFVAKPISPDLLIGSLCRWTGAQLGAIPRSSGVEVGADVLQILELSSVSGLDLKAGLSVVQGNAQLYERLLRKFSTESGDDLARLRACINAGAWQDARRIAHTLKGVAATLGAAQLRTEAAKVETMLAEGDHGSPALDAALAGLARLQHALVQALCAALPAEVVEVATMVDWTQVRQTVTELRTLLGGDDVRALQIARERAPMLRAALGGTFERVSRSVEAFEFEEALGHLDASIIEVPELEGL